MAKTDNLPKRSRPTRILTNGSLNTPPKMESDDSLPTMPSPPAVQQRKMEVFLQTPNSDDSQHSQESSVQEESDSNSSTHELKKKKRKVEEPEAPPLKKHKRISPPPVHQSKRDSDLKKKLIAHGMKLLDKPKPSPPTKKPAEKPRSPPTPAQKRKQEESPRCPPTPAPKVSAFSTYHIVPQKIIVLSLCDKCYRETNSRVKIICPTGKQIMGVMMCQSCVDKNITLSNALSK